MGKILNHELQWVSLVYHYKVCQAFLPASFYTIVSLYHKTCDVFHCHHWLHYSDKSQHQQPTALNLNCECSDGWLAHNNFAICLSTYHVAFRHHLIFFHLVIVHYHALFLVYVGHQPVFERGQHILLLRLGYLDHMAQQLRH